MLLRLPKDDDCVTIGGGTRPATRNTTRRTKTRPGTVANTDYGGGEGDDRGGGATCADGAAVPATCRNVGSPTAGAGLNAASVTRPMATVPSWHGPAEGKTTRVRR